MRQQLREILLGELDPARAAAGEQRQLLALGLAVEELVGLLDHGQVGGEGGVVDPVEAEALQRRDDLAGGVERRVACRKASPRATRTAGAICATTTVLRGSSSAFQTSSTSDRGRQRAGGADRGALAAVDALDLAQILAEGRQHRGLVAAVGEVDGADALDLGAEAHAVAAEHALVRIAHQRRARECPPARAGGRA